MTTIEITLNKTHKFVLTCKNHSQHDICVAISALVNSIVQYATEFEAAEKCTIAKSIYEHGNVELEIDFENRFRKRDFVQGIEAIFTGFELYQANFKDEVKFIKNPLPRGYI